MLDELKYVLGDSIFISAMQEYYERWKLKHPNEDRFINAIEDVSNQELDWFFDAWLHTTHHLDYGITSFKKLKNKNCDWIIANDISKNEGGFGNENNEVTIFYENKEMKKEKLSLKNKSEISDEIVDRIIAQIN